MEDKYFPLEQKENSRFVRIVQILFGVVCIATALVWIIYNIKSLETDSKLWPSIAFIFIFGIYLIMAGSGKTGRFIRTSTHGIFLKQHSVLPGFELIYADIKKIELYPLSIKFHMKDSKKISLRFGLSYAEIISPVKEEIIAISELNNIPLEVVEEEL
jgi:hypothetical protein